MKKGKRKLHVEIVTRQVLILRNPDGIPLERYVLPDPSEDVQDPSGSEECSSKFGRELDGVIERWEKGYRVDLGEASGLISEYLYE